jgi:hypothetical protein
MTQFLIYGLLSWGAVAATNENIKPAVTFASSTSPHTVVVRADQLTVNGASFPFEKEMLVMSDGNLCNALLAELSRLPRQITTRVGFQYDNKIVFLEAERQRKVAEDEEAPTRWVRWMRDLGVVAPPSFLSHYYEMPDTYTYGEFTMENNGVADLRVTHIRDPQHWLNLTIEDLRRPGALNYEDVADALVRHFRDRARLNAVLYDTRIYEMYQLPVQRTSPPSRHTTWDIVNPPPEGSQPPKPPKTEPSAGDAYRDSLSKLPPLHYPR